MKIINSLGDLRELARRRVPRAIFDYADRVAADALQIGYKLLVSKLREYALE